MSNNYMSNNYMSNNFNNILSKNVLKLIQNKKFDINYQRKDDGRTILMEAIIKHKFDIVIELIKIPNIDFKLVDNEGQIGCNII